MSASDLTSLAPVQAWLNIAGGQADAVLSRLITQSSRAILDYLQRASILSQNYLDVTDGIGGSRIYLDNWPVTSILSVTVDGQEIPAAPAVGGFGYRLQRWDQYPPGGPQAVELMGARFSRGRQNVAIAYVAGYLVSGEAALVPATEPFQFAALQPLGPWAADGGVAYADGTALALVAGSPAAGEYALSPGAPGTYLFAAEDGGAALRLSYSYVPGALEDACIGWVAERFRYRDHIGQRSKSLGGQETVSYDTSAMPAYLQAQLQPYRKVLPL